MKKIKKLASVVLSAMMMFSFVACDFLSTTSTSESAAHQHKTVHRTGIVPTCEKTGKLEYWECVGCEKIFSDADCTNEITKVEVNLPRAAHDLTHHARIEATEEKDGNIEYWTCEVCNKYFADVQGKSEITVEDIGLKSFVTAVDFVVEVPEDRDPVILQLGDPQVIDSSTMRPGRLTDQAQIEAWGPNTREDRVYKYIRETVAATNPDLILVSGDIVYGEFDDDGHLLKEFVQFMEGFDIPWAPIMGNHDVESAMGADWMCAQYENAANCMFKQGDIAGNGNYTIGIKQGGKLKRVIMNMDTNGCTGASEASKANGHTVTHQNNGYNGNTLGTYGLQPNQVQWFKDTIAAIKEYAPDVKVSYHFHIGMLYVPVAFNNAYKDLVGSPVASSDAGAFGSANGKVLSPERVKGHREGDIGNLYTLWDDGPDFWDSEAVNGTGKAHEIFYQMKATGADSFFMGHYHSNSVSIVYEGIRFQYGQKCSTYDTTQTIDANGKISYGNIYATTTATPLVGGTVISMDKDTGELNNPYIYYCAGAGKEVNWEQYKNTIG